MAIPQDMMDSIVEILREEVSLDPALAPALAPGRIESLAPRLAPRLAPVLAPALAPTMAAAIQGMPSGTTPVAIPVHGPWGSVMDVLLSLLPLVFLVLVTLIKWIQLPTKVSLPIAAIIMWLIRIVYFASPPNYVNALVVSGLLEALTPLSIIFGAILLFQVARPLSTYASRGHHASRRQPLNRPCTTPSAFPG